MAVSKARRAATLTAFWRVLASSRRPGDPGLVERLRATPRLLRAGITGAYPGLSRSRLAVMAAALVYIVSPVDLVPESFFLVLGLVDDVAVAAWLASVLLVETDRFLGWELAGAAATASARRRRPPVVPGEVLDSRPV